MPYLLDSLGKSTSPDGRGRGAVVLGVWAPCLLRTRNHLRSENPKPPLSTECLFWSSLSSLVLGVWGVPPGTECPFGHSEERTIRSSCPSEERTKKVPGVACTPPQRYWALSHLELQKVQGPVRLLRGAEGATTRVRGGVQVALRCYCWSTFTQAMTDPLQPSVSFSWQLHIAVRYGMSG